MLSPVGANCRQSDSPTAPHPTFHLCNRIGYTIDYIFVFTTAHAVINCDLKAAVVKELSTIWSGQSSVKDALTRAKAVADPILADGLSQIK